MTHHELATLLDDAARSASPVAQLSLQQNISEKEAYEIQAFSINRRYDRGEKLVGLKLGFTSKAKMEQMGVHDMIWGRLTDSMQVKSGESIDLTKYIHPRAEPEVAFLTNKKIDRAMSLEEVKTCVEGIAVAIEIIDSRFKNFKFSLEDVIADNCSSIGFVVGKWHDPNMALTDLKMTLEFDGEVVQSGSSNAILGDPWESMEAITRLATKYQQDIPAGSIILAGAATPAVYLKNGLKVKATMDKLGEVEFSVL